MGLPPSLFLADAFFTYGFLGQDTGVMKLDAMAQVYAMLSLG